MPSPPARGLIPCYQPPFNASDLAAALTPGGRRRDFESAFAARIGATYGLTFAYGRVGLYATLRALGFTDGEVILPAFTSPTVPEAVVASGNRPVFVDINPDDFNMDLAALARALSARTRAIIVTHLYGSYSAVRRVRELAQSERITILEDCAQRIPPAAPSSTGLLSDVAIYSLGRAKPVSTIRGGVVATNSAELYERIKTWRNQRPDRLPLWTGTKLWLWLLASYVVYRRLPYYVWQRGRTATRRAGHEASDPSYHPLNADAGSTLADFQARMGRNQLARLDATLASRRALAQAYHRELRSLPEVRPAPLLDGSTYTLYTVRVPRRDERQIEARMTAKGVMVGRTFDYILPELKPYRNLAGGAFPEAQQAARQVVNLPIHPDLSEADVGHIVDCLGQALASSRSISS